MADRKQFSQRKRAEIFARQGGRCAICKLKMKPAQYEIDHIAALVHEGSNDDDNLRAAHVRCHRLKSKSDVQANAKVKRIAAGGKQRKGPPMPGSKLSKWRKPFHGPAVLR